MSTITSPEIIRELLENNGKYEDDPQAEMIYSYETYDRTVYAVYWTRNTDIYTSPYVHNPHLLWSKKGGLTARGKAELQRLTPQTNQTTNKPNRR